MPRITKVKRRPPERIFLQWLDPEAGYAESWEVTWAEDQIDKTDPGYVRRDIFEELFKACEDTEDFLAALLRQSLMGGDLTLKDLHKVLHTVRCAIHRADFNS